MNECLTFDFNNLTIIDGRVPKDKIFFGAPFGVCYTLKTDDITVGEKPDFTPYKDRFDGFTLSGDKLTAKSTRSVLMAESIFGGGISFKLQGNCDDLSEYGVNLPFNFLSKKGGGGWQNQFLFNSPYFNENEQILYIYLTKPNGANLLIAVKGKVAGWKIDYAPVAYGHFLAGVKMLKNFDKAYEKGYNGNNLEFAVFPVTDFSDCLDKLATYYGKPFLNAVSGGGFIGEKVALTLHGNADGLIIKNKDGEKKTALKSEITLEREGITEIIPVSGGKCGAGVTVYCVRDLVDLYKKSMDSVDFDVLKNTDGNLCESQCWMSAMLRFLTRYSDRLSAEEIDTYESKLKKQLAFITETDENKAIPRLTVLNKPYENFPAYHIFKSTRLQEQFFGVTIFLDAYKYFKDEKYLTYAVNSMDCLLDNYQAKNGGLMRPHYSGFSDYTTVCCPMIPLVDLANFLRGKDDIKAEKYFISAQKMAEYVYERGFSFPTETAETESYEGEMEEGSIACSALLLLYYCKNVKREDRFINRAKEILDLHEPWVMNSADCRMKNSTLRWWETLWEGDSDGPSICAGHGWTIWRAEADYLYYTITGDENYLLKARNGFITNLAKINDKGESFAVFTPDLITGGGFSTKSEEVAFRIAGDFPTRRDSGLSRYVWIRINDTFLGEDK